MPKITDKDKGMQKILSELKKLDEFVVKAGILSSSGSVDGVSIVQYATWNENGVMGKNGWKIPPRPFIKGWANTKKEEIKTVLKTLYEKVASGKMTCDIAIKTLGSYAKSGIQEYIVKGDFKPNANYTIRKKGSSKPLIDTGAMRKAVAFEIEKR